MTPLRALAAGCAAALIASCASGSTPPPGADPPRVEVTTPEPLVVAPSFTLTVTVTGCATVKTLSLLESGVVLKALTPGATATVSLGRADLKSLFAARGLTAQLSFAASATCNDGRTGSSEATFVQFFPVSAAAALGTSGAFPTIFTVENGGATPASFVGCATTGTGTGAGRFNAQGAVVASNTTLPFLCGNSTYFFPRSSTGFRWMVDPQSGAAYLNDSLQTVAYSLFQSTRTITTANDHLVTWTPGGAGGMAALQKVANTGTPAAVDWSTSASGALAADPIEVSGVLSLLLWTGAQVGSGARAIVAQVRSSDGADGPGFVLHDLAGDANSRAPSGIFKADGTVVFIPSRVDSGSGIATTILACRTVAGGCTGTKLVWQSPVLQGEFTDLHLTRDNKYLLAVGASGAYFLNAATGAMANTGSAAFTPSIGRRFVAVELGQKSDAYLMASFPNALPSEAVVIDVPEKPELLRIQSGDGSAATSSLWLGTDATGALWLRVGRTLGQALSLADYRADRG